jgi:putative oxidoreductase
MLASAFILEGLDTFRHPERSAEAAQPVVKQLARLIPAISEQPRQVVRITGAVQLAAGSLLAIGRLPRLSALALAATLIPATATDYRFWETDDKQERARQRAHFLKNVSLLGGLLIASADTAGKPSLAWRTQHAAGDIRRDAALAARTARASGSAQTARASAKAAKISGRAAKASRKATSQAAKASRKATAKAAKATGQAQATAARYLPLS